MKLTNATMWESIQVLTKIQETGKLGYACARNLRKLMNECREYMEVRDKLLQKYGTSDGTGRYTFEKDQAAVFSKELTEFAAISHDVDVMQVDEETFYSGNLTSKDMFILSWMVVDKDSNEKEEPDVSKRDD